MKNLVRQCLAAALLASVFALQAQAQEFRVGFVNTDRIFKEATTAKAAQVKLEQEFSKREKELVDLGATLKGLSDKLEREAPTLGESQRSLRQKQLVDQDRDFQRKRREFQEDLNARKNEELAPYIEAAFKRKQAVTPLRDEEIEPVVALGRQIVEKPGRPGVDKPARIGWRAALRIGEAEKAAEPSKNSKTG